MPPRPTKIREVYSLGSFEVQKLLIAEDAEKCRRGGGEELHAGNGLGWELNPGNHCTNAARLGWRPAKRVLSRAKINIRLPSTGSCLTNYGHYLGAAWCNKLSLHLGASGMMNRGTGAQLFSPS